MDTGGSGIAARDEEEHAWILEHPKFKEMMKLDVADSAQIYAAFLVYMDLLEVRNWQEVQILGSPELQLVYLRGQERDESRPQVIIPTPVTMACSHKRIQQFLKLCNKPEEDQNTPSSILLAVVESDSTIVYYTLTDGFVIPDPPDFAEDVDNKRWKKKKIRCLR